MPVPALVAMTPNTPIDSQEMVSAPDDGNVGDPMQQSLGKSPRQGVIVIAHLHAHDDSDSVETLVDPASSSFIDFDTYRWPRSTTTPTTPRLRRNAMMTDEAMSAGGSNQFIRRVKEGLPVSSPHLPPSRSDTPTLPSSSLGPRQRRAEMLRENRSPMTPSSKTTSPVYTSRVETASLAGALIERLSLNGGPSSFLPSYLKLNDGRVLDDPVDDDDADCDGASQDRGSIFDDAVAAMAPAKSRSGSTTARASTTKALHRYAWYVPHRRDGDTGGEQNGREHGTATRHPDHRKNQSTTSSAWIASDWRGCHCGDVHIALPAPNSITTSVLAATATESGNLSVATSASSRTSFKFTSASSCTSASPRSFSSSPPTSAAPAVPHQKATPRWAAGQQSLRRPETSSSGLPPDRMALRRKDSIELTDDDMSLLDVMCRETYLASVRKQEQGRKRLGLQSMRFELPIPTTKSGSTPPASATTAATATATLKRLWSNDVDTHADDVHAAPSASPSSRPSSAMSLSPAKWLLRLSSKARGGGGGDGIVTVSSSDTVSAPSTPARNMFAKTAEESPSRSTFATSELPIARYAYDGDEDDDADEEQEHLQLDDGHDYDDDENEDIDRPSMVMMMPALGSSASHLRRRSPQCDARRDAERSGEFSAVTARKRAAG